MTDKHAFIPGGSLDDSVGPQDDVCQRCGMAPDDGAHKNDDGTLVVPEWDDYDYRHGIR